MSSLREHIERSERRSTDLDGATILPVEGAFAANAGEWAARWNARPQWQREQWVARHNENVLRQVACLEADHRGHIEYLQAENARLRAELEGARQLEPMCDRTLQCEARDHFLSCHAAPWRVAS